MDITHLYGLTETYGPCVVCEWRSEWTRLPMPEQARLKSRQGVGNVISCEVRVVDDQGHDVPADAQTMGEIAMRGNNVMLGYYLDDEATQKACPDGWFRTGDLGVMHPDYYIELRDRAKDIIISGGENISSVEIEQALASHPAVFEAAVVAAADEKWGEVPVAFVALKEERDRDQRRTDRPRAHAAGALQGAQADRLRPAAQDVHRQGAEEPLARSPEASRA